MDFRVNDLVILENPLLDLEPGTLLVVFKLSGGCVVTRAPLVNAVYNCTGYWFSNDYARRALTVVAHATT